MLIHRKRQKLLQLAAVAGFTIAAAVAQAIEKPTVTPGEPQNNLKAGPATAEAAGVINFKDLPAPSPSDPAAKPPRGLSPALKQLKAQAAQNHGQALPVTTQPLQKPTAGNVRPDTPYPPAVSFLGDSSSESCGGNVANVALAIGDGSNPIVQVTQNCVSVWSPSGTRLQGPATIASFFGLPAGTNVQFPRALYDWYNHRFIVAAIDEGSRYFIAVSQSDDPTAGWYHYTLATGLSGTTNDFTRLGQDRQETYPITSGTAYPGAIYLASNIVGSSVSEQWLILPKSAMYNGQGFSYWGFTGMTSWSVATDSSQPVNVWSPYDNPSVIRSLPSRAF